MVADECFGTPAPARVVVAIEDQSKGVHWFSRLKDGMIFMEALGRHKENQHGHNVKDNFGNQVNARPLATT